MAEQAGVCLAWSEIPEDTFCRVVGQIFKGRYLESHCSSYPPWQGIPKFKFQIQIQMSRDTTKRVSGVSDQARHKPACTATEAS